MIGLRSKIKTVSEGINKTVKDSKRTTQIDLPVLAYYLTVRLWKEGRENKKDLESKPISRSLPSRYRGYKDALEIKSSFKMMLDWFKSKFQNQIVNKETSPQFDCVKNVIINNIPNTINIKWVFDKDKIQTLYIVFKDGTETPFHFLSDGYRNILAIFADLAFRCVTLNPHYKEEANLLSEGVVLIDELDLHLHPSWQKDIVFQLKKTFPKIQFIATTHSPFIVQSLSKKELQNLDSTTPENPIDMTLNKVVTDVMGVLNLRSDNFEQRFQDAFQKFQGLDKRWDELTMDDYQSVKESIDKILIEETNDPVYKAFLKSKEK